MSFSSAASMAFVSGLPAQIPTIDLVYAVHDQIAYIAPVGVFESTDVGALFDFEVTLPDFYTV
jgi:hypothetical protein